MILNLTLREDYVCVWRVEDHVCVWRVEDHACVWRVEDHVCVWRVEDHVCVWRVEHHVCVWRFEDHVRVWRVDDYVCVWRVEDYVCAPRGEDLCCHKGQPEVWLRHFRTRQGCVECQWLPPAVSTHSLHVFKLNDTLPTSTLASVVCLITVHIYGMSRQSETLQYGCKTTSQLQIVIKAEQLDRTNWPICVRASEEEVRT